MRKNLLTRAFQALTGVLLGLAFVFWALRPGPPDTEPVQDSYFLPAPIPAPAFSLVSHFGDEVGSDSFPGRVMAIFFGYSSCPDICPLTLSNLTRAFTEMGETGERIQVLLVTVDPERDSPQRLEDYLAAFHPSFLGLTGTEEEIRTVADAFGAFFARSGEGADYTVDHTARTFVVDRQGMISLTFPVTATPEEMARDLSQLLEEGK